jgi:hypothetical protein
VLTPVVLRCVTPTRHIKGPKMLRAHRKRISLLKSVLTRHLNHSSLTDNALTFKGSRLRVESYLKV